jgi:hypothetical protein
VKPLGRVPQIRSGSIESGAERSTPHNMPINSIKKTTQAAINLVFMSTSIRYIRMKSRNKGRIYSVKKYLFIAFN